MKTMIALSLLSFSSASFATNIDLSSWSADTYNLTGGQTAGNWTLSNSNQTVTQTINADPSVYLNNLNQTNYSMDGSWKVGTSSDDDFIGFVFGYQNDHQYYVMDWKQRNQSASTYGYADAGFRILKIDALSRSALTVADFWDADLNSTNSTVLASNAGTGWADNTTYRFHLDFFTNPGEISILVQNDAKTDTLWDVTINDLSYTSGQFGFYNFSQQQVQYSGFTQTGGEIVPPNAVPVPAAALLFAPALLGFISLRRKAKQAVA